MGILRVAVASLGDDRFEWNPDDPESVAEAERKFNEYKEKGYKAYKVKHEVRREGDPLDEFDPTAGEIIVVPAVSGG